jgi:hypothetical protein
LKKYRPHGVIFSKKSTYLKKKNYFCKIYNNNLNVMKTKIALCLLIAFSIFSCKDGKTSKDPVKEIKETVVVESSNKIKLTTYSDSNWSAGVGIGTKMFLIENSPENEKLLKNGKELQFNDGKTISYEGINVAGGFIQILLKEKAEVYKSVAANPNEIIVK